MNEFIPSDKHIFTQKMLKKIDIGLIYTSMIAIRKTLLVFGGDNDGFFTPSAEVRMYDISGQSWYKISDMPHYLWGATAQKFAAQIFIMGGGRQSSYTSYNLVSEEWREKAGLPVSRKGLVSGTIDDIIYITGGEQMWGEYNVPRYCYSYDPREDAWKECNKPILSRAFAMSVVINNYLYVLGGYTNSEKKGNCISMDRYCPETDSWEAMPDMPRPRRDAVAVAMDSKIFVLCGGFEYADTTMDYYDTRTSVDVNPQMCQN